MKTLPLLASKERIQENKTSQEKTEKSKEIYAVLRAYEPEEIKCLNIWKYFEKEPSSEILKFIVKTFRYVTKKEDTTA